MRKKRHTPESDVVLDYGDAGLLFVEVKHLSRNDNVRQAEKFDRYLEGSPAFSEPAAARASSLYELCRNRRLAYELSRGRPFALVNLGPTSLFRQDRNRLDQFQRGVAASSGGVFIELRRKSLFEHLGNPLPDWLQGFLRSRLGHREGEGGP